MQIEKPVKFIMLAWTIKSIQISNIRSSFSMNFPLFISRADYWNEEWNQIAINEFISPLMVSMLDGRRW